MAVEMNDGFSLISKNFYKLSMIAPGNPFPTRQLFKYTIVIGREKRSGKMTQARNTTAVYDPKLANRIREPVPELRTFLAA